MEILNFNPSPSFIMHLDLNCCFATIEQQANALLRGRPIAVAAYDSPGGCILAPSIEAKRFGIKTGMRVREGKGLCPTLLILTPDPAKYRFVHLALRKILSSYTNVFCPKSIDEFVLDLKDYIYLHRREKEVDAVLVSSLMRAAALEIKSKIRKQIGDHLSVSIGIAPNRFLAKTASNLKKPDGLEEINARNFLGVFLGLELTDLNGINRQNEKRLRGVGIDSVLQFYDSPLSKLKVAFKSVNAYYWYLRLRGWEVDSVSFGRKSYGNSYALSRQSSEEADLSPILMRLIEKASARLRRAGFKTSGVAISIRYRDWSFWQKTRSLPKALFDTRDIYEVAFFIFQKRPPGQVRELYITCFNLQSSQLSQLELFEDVTKKARVTEAIDQLNDRFGDFVVSFGKSLKLETKIHDRIAFGGVAEL